MGGSSDHVSKLTSCHLLEVGSDDKLLWLWSYPYLEGDIRGICMSKCATIIKRTFRGRKNDQEEASSAKCNFFHINNNWYYVLFPSGTDDTKTQNVGVIIGAGDFNPPMYERVADIMSLTYVKTGDTSTVLQQFLSLVVEGICQLPKKKTFSLKDYEISSPYFKKHDIKGLVSAFGLESILIYTGLFRRRRIVVYHHDIDALADFILGLPMLCCDQRHDDILSAVYPWVSLSEDEVSLMKEIPFYVMGCLNAVVENRIDLFDIFINVPATEIIVAPNARESIAMNKVHKELATYMVQLAKDPEVTEDQFVDAISQKTLENLDKL